MEGGALARFEAVRSFVIIAGARLAGAVVLSEITLAPEPTQDASACAGDDALEHRGRRSFDRHQPHHAVSAVHEHAVRDDEMEVDVQVLAQRPSLAVEVVIDGAADLRNHLLERFPDALHLTDFFHVADHLAGALRLLFPNDDARRAAERAHWCHKLKHKRGTAWRLWRWLRDEMKREEEPVAAWARREIEKHAEYIYNQRVWMNYPDAVDAKAALGTGAVEAACKTLVTQRLKVSGASWSREGAGGVLYLRSLIQSERFDDGFAFRQATRHAA